MLEAMWQELQPSREGADQPTVTEQDVSQAKGTLTSSALNPPRFPPNPLEAKEPKSPLMWLIWTSLSM